MGTMSRSKFVIGQITDLHGRWDTPGSAAVVERRSRAVFELLPQAIDVLRAQGADFLVLTGDLVDAPQFIIEPNDYYPMPRDGWLPRIEADYRRVKTILESSGLPYMVLPGNHDYEPILWQVFDNSSHVVDVKADAGQKYRLARFCDREWEGHVPRRFDRERKLWMQMLSDVQSPPQIHLQHYVITPQVEGSYPHNYFESEHLRNQTVASGQVLLSLSGHYHRGSDLIDVDGCCFAVCPAFCEFPHPFRLYTLEANRVSMRTFTLLEQPHGAGRPAVFLDRDGVINTVPRYSSGPVEMALIPGAARAILRLRRAGYAVVVITNQSAIGAGHVSHRVVEMVHERMCQLLVEETGDVHAQPDAIFYAGGAGDRAVHPTLADQSSMKPSPALLERASSLLGLHAAGAWMVGDRASDLQAGRAVGATPILVRTGFGAETEAALDQKAQGHVFVCDHLAAAVEHILTVG